MNIAEGQKERSIKGEKKREEGEFNQGEHRYLQEKKGFLPEL